MSDEPARHVERTAAGGRTSTGGARLWPDHLLDVPALRRAGLQALPFREFVVKVHSRCNLACTYCYVYEGADQGWRTQPVVMTRRTAEQVCRRIAEHAERHAPTSLRVILHGGEPLLAGTAFLGDLVRGLRALVPAATDVDVLIQTNATLVDDDVLDLCHREHVRLGVSLDGDPATHDRFRRDTAGRGSHARVVAALRRLALPEHRRLWGGIVCTVDVEADPVGVYEHLLSHRPPAIRFLLPLGNWTHPPPGRRADDAETPYADWLIAVFDRWYHAPEPPTRISLFESLLDLLLGGPTRTETVGGALSQLIVVDTDGALTLSDQLKTAYPGADRSGHDVFRHSFDALLDHPGVVARQLGPAALSADCRACRIRDVCGGGHYPHRYRAGEGYLNPSVYCPDLTRLIDHVAGTLRADLVRPAEPRP